MSLCKCFIILYYSVLLSNYFNAITLLGVDCTKSVVCCSSLWSTLFHGSQAGVNAFLYHIKLCCMCNNLFFCVHGSLEANHFSPEGELKLLCLEKDLHKTGRKIIVLL